MLTYTVGGKFKWFFCRKEQILDLTTGYLMLLVDSRKLAVTLSSS